jgi:hypothetical protein
VQKLAIQIPAQPFLELELRFEGETIIVGEYDPEAIPLVPRISRYKLPPKMALKISPLKKIAFLPF